MRPSSPHVEYRGAANLRRAFDIVMRIVTSLVGLMMIASGSVWMMQGLGVGPAVIMQGFMVNDLRWTFYGAILATVGIAQIVWSFMRARV
jgi:hypothetical protein